MQLTCMKNGLDLFAIYNGWNSSLCFCLRCSSPCASVKNSFFIVHKCLNVTKH